MQPLEGIQGAPTPYVSKRQGNILKNKIKFVNSTLIGKSEATVSLKVALKGRRKKAVICSQTLTT